MSLELRQQLREHLAQAETALEAGRLADARRRLETAGQLVSEHAQVFFLFIQADQRDTHDENGNPDMAEQHAVKAARR